MSSRAKYFQGFDIVSDLCSVEAAKLASLMSKNPHRAKGLQILTHIGCAVDDVTAQINRRYFDEVLPQISAIFCFLEFISSFPWQQQRHYLLSLLPIVPSERASILHQRCRSCCVQTDGSLGKSAVYGSCGTNAPGTWSSESLHEMI